MTLIKTHVNRRSFIKTSALAGGGLVVGFSWLAGCKPGSEQAGLEMPEEWFDINGYVKIGDNGVVTIVAPNPEFGQNVKTSMPMIVAEELDVDWEMVIVEQANLNTAVFERQFTGGSQGIRSTWQPLRMAGATARHMLKQAAAQTWNVRADQITTSDGMLKHELTGNKAGYGEMASLAATLTAPKEVTLKEVKDFKIIGNSKKNVEGKAIVMGEPLFGMDHKMDGALTAMIVHPPAFGLKLKSFDGDAIKSMPGIKDVFPIETLNSETTRGFFDTNAFPEMVAIVGNSTWEVLKAKRALNVQWEEAPESSFSVNFRGREMTNKIPAGLESTVDHQAQMAEMAAKPSAELRKDGNPEKAFEEAAQVIERTYTAPYLAHNCMEPQNCFANVTADRVEIYGPTQAPELIEQTISSRLGVPVENIDINLARMGGGFGRRAYSHYMIEAALISQKVGAPIKLQYTREDDMTFGIYRPTYHATYRAALDENGNMTAFHVKAGGIPESPIHANRFPAGAIDNYLAESWSIESNITIGAFRAPRSNFISAAEQSFLDEVAEAGGKDPIQFRLDLLKRSKENPVGENNDYDPDRYAGVLELVREKSNWEPGQSGNRGVSAYFCHNSYAAHVVDLKVDNGTPKVENVTCAVDCGVVVNPDAAANMAQGAIVDGIGNAFYGELRFNNGVPEKSNFDRYRMIRMSEVPKAIDVHFVQNEIDPTGMGEPPFPPIFGAIANALYKATGKRQYDQPYFGEGIRLG
jgi:isoquinoline 1-oxidoreductase beta subunit